MNCCRIADPTIPMVTLKEACPEGKISIVAFHDDLAFNAFKQEVESWPRRSASQERLR